MSHATNPGNPAVIGLAGFGMTTFVLQLHNLGLCGFGPVFALGLIFGGAAQFWAGLQELKHGNNFGACAFVGYGSFWITLILIQLSARFNLFPVQPHDLTWFLVAFTLFTAVLWVVALRISKNLAIVFTLLLLGFIFLVLTSIGIHAFKVIAAIDLILCAGAAVWGAAMTFYGELLCKGEGTQH